MKKHIQTSLSLALALTMMVTTLPTAALAADVDTEKEQTVAAVQYADAATSGTCGDNLTWTLENGVLTISGSGAMENWDGSDDTDHSPWQYICERITSVVISQGVTSIGNDAFAGCYALTSITIPDSVTSIGDSAFDNCSSIASISIPDSVTSIGKSAFSGCYALSNINIPDGITSIGGGMFAYCETLTSITIPDSVTSIGDSAFYWCKALTNVNIPDGVTSIGVNAFYYCSSLSSITIPDGVTSIGAYAFRGCGSLDVTVPASAWRLGRLIFDDDTTIVGYTGSSASCYAKYYALAFRSLGRTTLSMQFGDNITGTIQDGVLTISGTGDMYDFGTDSFPFWSIYDFSTVEIEKGVTSIGVSAFCNLSSLTSITIPSSVTNIGEAAFRSCSKLKDVYFEGPTTITESIHTLIDPNWGFYSDESLCSFWGDTVTLHYPVGNAVCAAYIAEASEIHANCGYDNQADCHITWLQDYECDDPCADGHTWDEGTVTKAATGGEKGIKTYTCQICGETKEEEITLVFTDVPEDTWYTDAVAWAVDQGITQGTSDTTFSPLKDCTRAQVVTFLWRAAGCPEPTTTENPFTDVADDNDYYKAILWAAESGITDGTSDTTFSPSAVCTRAQVVTFLWRANGKPSASTSAESFTDVAEGEYYADAVAWAVEQHITDGMGNGEFAPGKYCNRAQVVTFLYRNS